MAISTNSVIHYTERIDNLKSILKCEGFRMKYCMEELEINLSIPISSAIPMISFCDIPLSEVKNHIDSYGSYGIGLSKSWAKNNGLNPVLYLEKDSKLSEHIKDQVERILEGLEKVKKGKKLNLADKQLQKDMITYVSYCKNYEGKLVRGKINTETYRFYDEKEWRYVGVLADIAPAPRIIYGDEYKNNKEKYNSAIEDRYINFSTKDISYLIVDSENEIPEILTLLNEIFEDKCTAKELKILSTKILTKNQIHNDF
jgi:hypothetical protein